MQTPHHKHMAQNTALATISNYKISFQQLANNNDNTIAIITKVAYCVKMILIVSQCNVISSICDCAKWPKDECIGVCVGSGSGVM